MNINWIIGEKQVREDHDAIYDFEGMMSWQDELELVARFRVALIEHATKEELDIIMCDWFGKLVSEPQWLIDLKVACIMFYRSYLDTIFMRTPPDQIVALNGEYRRTLERVARKKRFDDIVEYCSKVDMSKTVMLCNRFCVLPENASTEAPCKRQIEGNRGIKVGEDICRMVIGRPKRVLDFACGDGSIGAFVSKQYDAELHSYDVRPDLTSVSLSFVESHHNYYDLIIVSMALHHIRDVNECIGLLRSVLSSDGQIIVREHISNSVVDQKFIEMEHMLFSNNYDSETIDEMEYIVPFSVDELNMKFISHGLYPCDKSLCYKMVTLTKSYLQRYVPGKRELKIFPMKTHVGRIRRLKEYFTFFGFKCDDEQFSYYRSFFRPSGLRDSYNRDKLDMSTFLAVYVAQSTRDIADALDVSQYDSMYRIGLPRHIFDRVENKFCDFALEYSKGLGTIVFLGYTLIVIGKFTTRSDFKKMK